jgi:hypothetical protein
MITRRRRSVLAAFLTQDADGIRFASYESV